MANHELKLICFPDVNTVSGAIILFTSSTCIDSRQRRNIRILFMTGEMTVLSPACTKKINDAGDIDEQNQGIRKMDDD
ncbi:hypothetical protein [Labrenzia sp. OB1]|uniref:hypothetical protein n=1 Tax=Labrenzia sp. OB1 TaxID=1561204 RepID=UPI0018FE635F|nr:hypothetical protein [Labrenzia sp. OB1]